ncbi:hypothetical protein DYI25_18860 [Mesobacillus boroniphilus]|uniref:Uncharacterized protein n=1 Tax=Mesobacillus boroniphilus TaxID=308892 RepID=A0A944CPH5_9BACI|nr:hypothetical protein [Mesobacillus boroniphilus]
MILSRGVWELTELEICDRKEKEPKISVTSWRNMCPKRGGAEDFGNKLEEHVPEQRRSRKFR